MKNSSEKSSSELFATIFDVLRESLTDETPLNTCNPSLNESQLEFGAEEHLLRVIAEKSGTAVEQGTAALIASDAAHKLASVHHRWKIQHMRRENRMARLRLRQKEFANRTDQALNAAKLRDVLYKKRLQQQLRNASRRLQELMFECLGEFEKARQRGARRTKNLCSNVDAQSKNAADDLRWSTFLARFEEDVGAATSLVDVSPSKKPDEFAFYAVFCHSLIMDQLAARDGDGNIAGVSIQRVVLVRSHTQGRRRQPPRDIQNVLSPPCETTAAIGNLLRRLAHVVLGNGRSGRHGQHAAASTGETGDTTAGAFFRSFPDGAPAIPGFPADLFISSSVLTWLFAADLCAVGGDGGRGGKAGGRSRMADSRIYYCVEERSSSQQQAGATAPVIVGPENEGSAAHADALASFGAASAVCRAVASRYAASASQPASASSLFSSLHRGSSWRVSRTVGHHRQAVSNAAGDVRTEVLSSVPDVLQVSYDDTTGGLRRDAKAPDQPKLHFACANVLNLLETIAMTEKFSSLTPTGKSEVQRLHPGVDMTQPLLQNLYIAVEKPSTVTALNPLESATLQPLTAHALQELIEVYVVRTACLGGVGSSQRPHHIQAPNAATVFPDSGQRGLQHKYCVLQNPVIPDQDRLSDGSDDWAPQQPSALLIQYNELPAGSSAVPSYNGGGTLAPKKSKKKWDTAILSNFCRWRACLAASTSHPTPKYLCAAHTTLKSFLDSKSKSGSSESSRYLPKKAPTSHNNANAGVNRSASERLHGSTAGDLATIRSASSLLQELSSGKLASTIKMFCQRAAVESSEKRRYLKSKGGKSQRANQAPKSRWLQGEQLVKERQRTNRELQVAQQVYATECAVSSELKKLCELGVYPSEELALIRRQYKSLERELMESYQERESNDQAIDDADGAHQPPRAESDMELEFCDRKLLLLRQRREDEESTFRLKMAQQQHFQQVAATKPAATGGNSGSPSREVAKAPKANHRFISPYAHRR